MLTMGYFSHPAVLRTLQLAPYAIESPVCEADLLYPRVGQPRESIAWGPEDLAPAPERGVPLALDGPLHPDYAEGSR